jgi:hypothetical protein
MDDRGEKTLFGQLFSQAKDRIEIFSKKPSHDSRDNPLPFKAKLKGEGSEDIGGVFREIIDLICWNEFESESLPLFIKTPNNVNAYGEDREKWTINPSSLSHTHLEMFAFLGALIGMSLRSNHLLALNLPSIFWKLILSHELVSSDLTHLDSFCAQVLINT